MNFYQMCDKMNGGKPYDRWANEHKPILPNFLDYIKGITNSSKVMTAESGNWNFKPLADEDIARYGAEDVIDHLKKHKPTTRLGDPMTNEEYRKFMGVNCPRP